ncbi:hypothetical protein QAD02_011557 [Eretmocerus hayati]|uniref:Uncharacterized protein n=1 Tax=Eretmocerus hayati TaxID=131215 RepID=A0ACC2NX89_9HYME|nr:hypothetical protein QAD02_011557 [Eretmocerus hayati]
MENLEEEDPNMETDQVDAPECEVKLEDIEPPATPESTKDEVASENNADLKSEALETNSENEAVKVESPKVWKPVLGKIQAKKRLMAFANKFSPIPKVNKLKTKADKVKREEKILAIEEIVREENKSRQAAQEMREISVKNILQERKMRDMGRDQKRGDHFSRRSTSYRRGGDRDRRRNRDRRSRSRSRPRSGRKSPQDDERYGRNKHKDRRDRDEKRDDRKDIPKNKREELKPKEDNSKLSDRSRREPVKYAEANKEDRKSDLFKQDSKNESRKSYSTDFENREKKPQQKIEDIPLRDDFDNGGMDKVINDFKKDELKHERIKNVKQDHNQVEKTNIDTKHERRDRKEKMGKSEIHEREFKRGENNKESISERSKWDDDGAIRNEKSKWDDEETPEQDEIKVDRSRRESKSEVGKKGDMAPISRKEENESDTSNRDDSSNDAKRDDDRGEIRSKWDEMSYKRDDSRDKKSDRIDGKEKREESRVKVHRDRGREKDKLRELREKELSRCRSWKDFRKYGFSIDDVAYLRGNDVADKMDKVRTAEDYNEHLEQVLLLRNSRQERYPFVAEAAEEGTKEYPPEMIKITKSKPPLAWSGNPKLSIFFNRQFIFSAVSPDRREKLADICQATQIRIITSEREEGHHERPWYKTLDPSKSISIRTSVEVPSFPRSKWDSENELSDVDDNVFEKTSQETLIPKEKSRVTDSSLKSESDLRKSYSQLKAEQHEIDVNLNQEVEEEPERVPMIEKEAVLMREKPRKSRSKSRSKKQKEAIPTDQPCDELQLKKSKRKKKRLPGDPSKKKDKSATKKNKEDKKEKHRSKEDKHHRHHRHHKDKKRLAEEQGEIGEVPSEKDVSEAKSDLTPEPEVRDDKLVSEYEQFMKMVSTSEPTEAELSPSQQMSSDSRRTSSSTNFFDFSLEAKLTTSSTGSVKLPEIPMPLEEPKQSVHVSKASPSVTKTARISEKEVSDELSEETEKVKENSPSPAPKAPRQKKAKVDEVSDNYEPSAEESSEGEDKSPSVPSDWELIKVKKEKISDEANELTSPTPVKKSKGSRKNVSKKRKRHDSSSSDSSSSSSSDSDDEDSKAKRRKRKRKRARKSATTTSSSESDSSSSSSSESSSSEEVVRKKRKRKAEKKKRKRKRLKKLSKKLKKKQRKRKAESSDSSSDSSESEDEPPKKKRARKGKAKKKSKQSDEKESPSKPKANGTKSKQSGKRSKTSKTSSSGSSSANKDDSKSSSKSSQEYTEPEITTPDQIDEEIKLVKSPLPADDDHSEWEKDSCAAKEFFETSKTVEPVLTTSIKKEKIRKEKPDTRETIPDKNINTVDTKLSEVETKKSRKNKKDDEMAKWDMEQANKALEELKKKPNEWVNTDFDSLNVITLSQLQQHHQKPPVMPASAIRKSEIFVNEWEVDSLDALPEPVPMPVPKVEVPKPVPKVESPKPVEPPKMKIVDKEIRYDKTTDTYIPYEVPISKESKKKEKKEKRTSTVRIWEDEQENAEREERMLLEKENKEKASAESENKKNAEAVVKIETDDKSSSKKRNRWDVENQAGGFENAQPVMWEVENQMWQPKQSIDNLISVKTEKSVNSPLLEAVSARVKDDPALLTPSFNSPLLEAMSARVKDDSAKYKSSSSRFTPPKQVPAVDSPGSVRRKRDEIRMLERAFSAKDMDTLDLEGPKKSDSVAKKEHKPISKNKEAREIATPLTSSRKVVEDKTSKRPADIVEASEFGIPVLAEIDSKLDQPTEKPYRDVFDEMENLDFERNVSDKAIQKPIEPSASKDTSRKNDAKLTPKQSTSRQIPVTSESLEASTKKKAQLEDIESDKKVPESSHPEQIQPSSKSSKASSSPPSSSSSRRKSSPSRSKDNSENHSKTKSSDKDSSSRDRRDHRTSRRSPAGSSSKSDSKSEGGRTGSPRRSRSRSRSRSPRRRSDKSKSSSSKRDRRTPDRRSSSHRDKKSSSSASSKSDRSRKRYDDSSDRDKPKEKPYDPMEILRERNYEGDRLRGNRPRIDEEEPKSRRGDEKLPINPYPSEYNHENRGWSRDSSLDRDGRSHSSHSLTSSSARNRSRDSSKYDRRDRRDSRSPDSPLSRREKLPPLRKSSPPPPSRLRRSRSRCRNESRPLDKSRRSRSWSPMKNRYSGNRIDDEALRLEDEARRLGESSNLMAPMLRTSDGTPLARPSLERSRRMDTIIQLTGGPLDEPKSLHPSDRYPVSSTENEFKVFYQPGNLTYPKIDDEATDSPKRLSLDDRLELELGIKKSPAGPPGPPSSYSAPRYLPNLSGHPGVPPPGQHPYVRHQQQTVLQVGDVLQVIPGDFPPRPAESGQIVRVGNVLEVVPSPAAPWSQQQQQQQPSSAGASPVVRFPQPPPVVVTSSPATVSPIILPGVVRPPVLIAQQPVLTSPAVTFSAPKVPPPEPLPQPVYNYEAILEERRIEKEERKRLREIKRKEKERRRFERAKKRAEKILGTGQPIETTSSPAFGENVVDKNQQASLSESETIDKKELDEEGKELQRQVVAKEVACGLASIIPPAPAKGILILPGFGNISMTNGILESGDDADTEKDRDSSASRAEEAARVLILTRTKKSVQFADGIKPGEGTSPSGGEGDMPSPPPPESNSSKDEDSLDITKKLRTRKIRKKQKRTKPQKSKKKIKVKIITLKKPKLSPVPALGLDDSDEDDDRSPPPPPPGSPPPPHMWPSYLQTWTTTVLPKTGVVTSTVTTAPITTSPATTTMASSANLPAPPTPLPLLVPPPPLNYSIQPCSKA